MHAHFASFPLAKKIRVMNNPAVKKLIVLEICVPVVVIFDKA